MAQKQKDAYNAMKAQMPVGGNHDEEGDGDLPEDEANQLRSKTQLYRKQLYRKIHVVANEPYQINMPIRSRRLHTCEQISIGSLN